MRASAILLSEYRSEIVALACNKCERRGRYRKSSLVAIHGPKIALSDLRSRFAADAPVRIAGIRPWAELKPCAPLTK